MVKKLIFLGLTLFTISSQAQTSVNGKDAIGIWKTVDDETGRTKSKVKIYEKNGKIYGRIQELLDPETLEDSGVNTFEEVICHECPKNWGKGKPVLNLLIIWDMEKQEDKWSDGNIMDPENGKIYGCTMWLDKDDNSGNTLKVRGWLAFFYRTQTWYREE